MKIMAKQLYWVLCVVFLWFTSLLYHSCAVIIPPNGGPRDTLAPKLVMASPKDSSLNSKSQKIVLSFDEFVEIKDVMQNVLISPLPTKSPLIDYHLKNIVIKLRDSLEPNTTYSINFGNAIRDVNEGNVFKDYTYAFSTGKTLANGRFSGKVILAETGKVDSSLIVVLHKNMNDTAIYKSNPRYIAKINGQGNFEFNYIEHGEYNAFVLPNEYSKKYDDSTKLFAFIDSTVSIDNNTAPSIFYCYQEAKKKEKPAVNNDKNAQKTKEDKRIKFETSADGKVQDLLTPLTMRFNKKLEWLDSTKIQLTDTSFNPLDKYKFVLDTSKTFATLNYPWKECIYFKLIIAKDAVKDTFGSNLPKGDTLSFSTRNEAEYGSLKLRFTNLVLSKHPVMQIIANDKIEESVILKTNAFKRKLFKPGDYIVRILFDGNENGVWDAGNYKKRLQPEVVFDKNWKVNVKANWDNETEIVL